MNDLKCSCVQSPFLTSNKPTFPQNPTLTSVDELTAARRAVGEKIDTDICTVFDALEVCVPVVVLHKQYGMS